MLFSDGTVTYPIFQEIAMSKIEKSWIPALRASLGFLVGMIEGENLRIISLSSITLILFNRINRSLTEKLSLKSNR